ncbi:hypothetical protein ACHAPC_007496 [Botrytis cinerea]
MVPLKNNQAPKKGSAPSGSSVGSKHDPKVPGSSKRKVDGSHNQASKKKKSDAARMNKAFLELSLCKDDVTRPVNGRDRPSGSEIRAKNRSKGAMVVLKPVKDSFDGTDEIKMLDYLASSLELESQNVVVHPIEDRIFKLCNLGERYAALNVDAILSMFANNLDTPELTVKQAEELLTFAGDPQAKGDDAAKQKGGFFALNFTVKVRISPPKINPDARSFDDTRALEFQRMLKKGQFKFTLIRRFGNFLEEIVAYWTHRVAVCAQEGLWAIYNDHLKETLGRRFNDWYTSPTKCLPHEPWMAEASAEKDKIQRYVTHDARNNFGSMEGREIVLSAAVIHDIAASVKFNEQYYNLDRTYEAIVRYVKRDHAQLEFDIRGGLTFLSISRGTRFLVRCGRFTIAEEPNAELESDEDKIENGIVPEEEENDATTGATNITSSQENLDTKVIDKNEGEQAIYDSNEDEVSAQEVVIVGLNDIEWTAQVLVAKENRQFVISFNMPKGKKRKFHVGRKVNIQLKVLSNHLNTIRQLKAIGMVTEDKAKDDAYGRILQRVILGEGMADVRDDIEDHLLALKAITYNQLPLLNQKVYDQWLENCGLNLMQREAYDAVIEDVLPATIIQGQFRTARSLTSGITCVGIAQLGHKVLYAAPTNAATATALLSIFKATQKLFEAVDNETTGVNPAPGIVAEVKELEEKFRIIHLSANASTEDDFMKRDDKRKDGEEDDPLEAHRISNHVIKSFHRKANDSELSNTIRNKGRNWLAMLREGKSVPAERFVKEEIDEIENAVRDARTEIIVSTCNNSAPRREMGFKPQVVMVDGASSAREPDCIIPLTFDQAHIILYGDSRQKLVVPAVRSFWK